MLLHYWESVPKFLRVICWIVFGFCTVLGALIGLRAGAGFFTCLIIFTLVGLINAAITLGAYYAVIIASRKATEQKIDSMYQQKGYCDELAQLSEQVFIMGDLRLKLKRAFYYLMNENYEGAEKYIRVLVDENGTQREMAMVNTMRMWLYAMTGRIERAESLFESVELKQNQAYEMLRDMDGYHPQLDDSLLYYLLASAFALRLHDGARLSDYRSEFMFQVTKRCDPDQRMYPRIYELFLLYASNRFEEASQMEHSLLAEIQTSTGVPYGRRADYTRMVNQARLFAKYVEVVKQVKQSRPTADDMIGQIEGLSAL